MCPWLSETIIADFGCTKLCQMIHSRAFPKSLSKHLNSGNFKILGIDKSEELEKKRAEHTEISVYAISENLEYGINISKWSLIQLKELEHPIWVSFSSIEGTQECQGYVDFQSREWSPPDFWLEYIEIERAACEWYDPHNFLLEKTSSNQPPFG